MTPTMAPGLRATVSAVCRAEDLTAAIKAVIPHTGKEKDGGGVERVRVVADVEFMRLALVATNRQRAAVALVPLLEVDDPTELDAETDTTEGLDFTAPALKVITQVFKSPAPIACAWTSPPRPCRPPTSTGSWRAARYASAPRASTSTRAAWTASTVPPLCCACAPSRSPRRPPS